MYVYRLALYCSRNFRVYDENFIFMENCPFVQIRFGTDVVNAVKDVSDNNSEKFRDTHLRARLTDHEKIFC